MRVSRKFFSEGGQIDNAFCFLFHFLVYKGIEDTNTFIGWPSLVRQQNAIEMAFPWPANDGPTLYAGLVAL